MTEPVVYENGNREDVNPSTFQRARAICHKLAKYSPKVAVPTPKKKPTFAGFASDMGEEGLEPSPFRTRS